MRWPKNTLPDNVTTNFETKHEISPEPLRIPSHVPQESTAR
jgi:hypothetical protein